MGRRKWRPTPVFLPGESHGPWSLVGCCQWLAQSWTQLQQLSMHACMHWRGHGNPLQYSCLENPRGGGAWWAAVCGVVQSRTRLKPLSSSSYVFPGGSGGKETACNVGNPGLIPGSGTYNGEGNVNPFQDPCLENTMDREA